MRVRIKKWGNSASVRIPASLMASVPLQLDQTVEMTGEGGRIVIKPVAESPLDLDRMIDAMDPETYPEDAHFGLPRGREAW